MITVRKSKERGFFDHGWLKTYHTFSFGDYQDPKHHSFRSLRVINEDYIAGGGGFGTHGHRDMEIITYIVKGQLEHKDSMGNGSVIHAGDVQYMCAGSGVQHSEFNPQADQDVKLLQIWIFPNAKTLKPRYDQKHFKKESKINQLKLIVSGSPAAELIQINQDAKIFASILEKGKTLAYTLTAGRGAWVQVVSGTLSLNSTKLTAGDGASVSDESAFNLTADEETEFLLFDLV